jgi:hypothetical protein
MLLPVGPCPRCAADLDQNGDINGGDLAHFLTTCEQGGC